MCQCNTVLYSLISACAGCQKGKWLSCAFFFLPADLLVTLRDNPPTDMMNGPPIASRAPRCQCWSCNFLGKLMILRKDLCDQVPPGDSERHSGTCLGIRERHRACSFQSPLTHPNWSSTGRPTLGQRHRLCCRRYSGILWNLPPKLGATIQQGICSKYGSDCWGGSRRHGGWSGSARGRNVVPCAPLSTAGDAERQRQVTIHHAYRAHRIRVRALDTSVGYKILRAHDLFAPILDALTLSIVSRYLGGRTLRIRAHSLISKLYPRRALLRRGALVP